MAKAVNQTVATAEENPIELFQELASKQGRALQKTFIKKLWLLREELCENLSEMNLRMIFFVAEVPVSPEGVKLLAYLIPKIGTINALRLLQKLIIEYGVSNTVCQRYGEVFKTAWKQAAQEEDDELKKSIEDDIIGQICHLANFGHDPMNDKFREVLVPFAHQKKSNKLLDVMITEKLNSSLYRGLIATNDVVRTASANTFFMFFPLVDNDSEVMKQSLEEQCKIMHDLLTDNCTIIRTNAVKKVLKCLGEYWLLIPKEYVRKLMGLIIDKLSRDSVISVRVAVFHGLLSMVAVPACMTAFEHALKCIGTRGINDRSDRVRFIAFLVLNQLKNHRFINVFDIVSRDEVIARLEIETVEDVRKQIVNVMHSLLPISKNIDEAYYKPRINYVISKSRLAILTYFRLLYSIDIVDVHSTKGLVEMLLQWTYRYLRTKDNVPPLAADSEEYRKSKIYLECALVLYLSAKGGLSIEENAAIKEKIEIQFAKVVSRIFKHYKTTPIMGAAMAICASINKEHLKNIPSEVFGMLEGDEVELDRIEAFLEAASHFNMDGVFDLIERGLDLMVAFLAQAKSTKKGRKIADDWPEELAKSLHFLKAFSKSHQTPNLLYSKDLYRQRVIKFTEKIDSIREIIDMRLLHNSKEAGEKFVIDDETLLLAMELRILMPIVTVPPGLPRTDVESAINLSKVTAEWFDTNVAGKMGEFEEEAFKFSVKVTERFVDCQEVAFSAFNFSIDTKQLDSSQVEDEKEENDGEVENAEDVTITQNVSMAEIVSNILVTFCNSTTPVQIFLPVMKLAAVLCEDENTNCHQIVVKLMNFTPRWVNQQCKDEDEDEGKLDEKAISDSIRNMYRKVAELEAWDVESSQKLIKYIVMHSLSCLMDDSDEIEFEDPRLHDYEMPTYVSIMTLKFVCREKELLKETMKKFEEMLVEGHEFLGGDVEPRLIKLSAMVQFLRIVEKMSPASAKPVIETCRNKAKSFLAEDLTNVKKYVINSLTNLLDIKDNDEE